MSVSWSSMVVVRMYALYLMCGCLYLLWFIWSDIDGQAQFFAGKSRVKGKQVLEIVNGESIDVTDRFYLKARAYDERHHDLYYALVAPVFVMILALIYWQAANSQKFVTTSVVVRLITGVLLIVDSHWVFICARQSTCMPVAECLITVLRRNQVRVLARVVGTIEVVFAIVTGCSCMCSRGGASTSGGRSCKDLRSLFRMCYGVFMLIFGVWSWVEPNSLSALFLLNPQSLFAGMIDFRYARYKVYQPGQRYPGNGPLQYIGWVFMHVGLLNIVASARDDRMFFTIASRMVWLWSAFYALLIYTFNLSLGGLTILIVLHWVIELPVVVSLIQPPASATTSTTTTKTKND